MSSEVEICNVALARLGDSATVASIDPPEGSAQAEHCKRFYPIARSTLIDRHAWGFCTVRGGLSLLTDPPLSGWQYAYAVPSKAVSILAILPDGAPDDQQTQPYDRETLANGTQVIYTNIENPVCRYKIHVTDTARFPPLFVDALAWTLASYLAGPVLKGDSGRKATIDCTNMAERQLAHARAADCMQRKIDKKHTPDWIAARGADMQTPDALVQR